MSTLRLKVITPTRIFIDTDVTMVEFNTTEGILGIYPNHIPLTAIIAPGVLRIHNDNDIKEAALLSGFVEILDDSVTIMAEACEWPDEIDENRAMDAKIRAERRLGGMEDGSDIARAELALKRALVRIDLKNR